MKPPIENVHCKCWNIDATPPRAMPRGAVQRQAVPPPAVAHDLPQANWKALNRQFICQGRENSQTKSQERKNQTMNEPEPEAEPKQGGAKAEL